MPITLTTWESDARGSEPKSSRQAGQHTVARILSPFLNIWVIKYHFELWLLYPGYSFGGSDENVLEEVIAVLVVMVMELMVIVMILKVVVVVVVIMKVVVTEMMAR